MQSTFETSCFSPPLQRLMAVLAIAVALADMTYSSLL